MEENAELLRPGFSRFSLPYTLTDTEVNYVIKAVLFVAKDGWKFLPQYRLDAKVLSLSFVCPFFFFLVVHVREISFLLFLKNNDCVESLLYLFFYINKQFFFYLDWRVQALVESNHFPKPSLAQKFLCEGNFFGGYMY
jgi:hypothetical protein